ncbi:hypothetical protein [Streptomyces sp. NPDC059970]|uniref:hypothetical protein n=1 Tax=Streptomyces sp. NPDC059970 TaxID=3347019 RepID=UPI003689AC5E
MTTQTETATMTGPEAYAKAVEYAERADAMTANIMNPPTAAAIQALAALSTAYASIAQAEATARGY